MEFSPAAAKVLLDMCLAERVALTFDDVLLEPQYSEIESRSTIDINTNITPLRKLAIPLISSNMTTVTESKMAIAMGKLGGLGIIHRYMPYEKQIEEVKRVFAENLLVAAAVGVKNGIIEHTQNLVTAGCSLIAIDVAHGYHKLVGDLLEELKKLQLISIWDNKPVEFIAGNVAIPQGVEYLAIKGADCIRIGIGSGSICSTRLVTGHGVPQLLAVATSSLMATRYNKTIIADGGLRTSGDICKVLAAGTNSVMCGFIFAGTDESPGELITTDGKSYKTYSGMASASEQKSYYGNAKDAPEGVNAVIPCKGPVKDVVKQLIAGIKSGLSYSGCNNLEEFKQNASWIRISTSGLKESKTIID